MIPMPPDLVLIYLQPINPPQLPIAPIPKTVHQGDRPVNFSHSYNNLFLIKELKIAFFFSGQKLDILTLTMYYYIMRILAKIKYTSPLPLFKI